MTRDDRPGEWPDLVRQFVLRRQRDAYWWIGQRLGLGDDPEVIFRQLTRPLMPRPKAAPDDLPLSEQERAEFERRVDANYERFFRSVEPPTPLEDPNRYANLMVSYELEKDEPAQGAEPMPEPVLATLPLGSPNAWISEIPGGDRSAIFFDYALFDYLYDFSKLMGLVLPELPLHRLDDAGIAALAQRRGWRFQVSPAASSALAATFLAWAVTSRTGEPSPVPTPRANVLLSAGLLHYMERFVVAHELAHLHLGHRPSQDRAASYAREYEADREGADRVCRGDPREAGPWSFRRWSVDLALGALALFDQALRKLAHGGQRVAWISPTHPDFLSRRERLRLESQQAAPTEVEWIAYQTLNSLADTVLGHLAPWVTAALHSARESGLRPSPLWERRLKASMRVNPGAGG